MFHGTFISLASTYAYSVAILNVLGWGPEEVKKKKSFESLKATCFRLCRRGVVESVKGFLGVKKTIAIPIF